MTVAVGDIKRHDLQADIYEMPYEVVEHLGGNRWLCRHLEPDEQALERMAEIEAEENPYIRPWEDLERIMAQVGETFEVRFVSREQWAAAF